MENVRKITEMQKEEVEFTRETGEETRKKEFWGVGLRKRIGEWLRARDEWEVRQRLGKLAKFSLLVALAFLAGGVEILFGTFPVAIALVCADRGKLAPILAGLSLAVIMGELTAVVGFCCLILLLLRLLATLLPALFRDKSKATGEKKAESSVDMIPYNAEAVSRWQETEDEDDEEECGQVGNPFARMLREEMPIKLLVGAVGGFICGFCLMVGGGFSFYSLCSALFLTASVPAGVLLLDGYLGECESKRLIHRWLSVGAILLFCVLAARERTILGMPMAPFLAMLFSLSTASRRGFLAGAGASLLCGVAYDLIYIPLLLLAVGLLCLISPVKKSAGVAAVCGLIVVWCYYIGGENGLLQVLPPMLLALPVFMLVDKYRELMGAPYGRIGLSDGIYFAEAVTEKSKNELARERLGALSDAFDSLSESFYRLSDRFRRSDALGLKQIADEAFEEVCRGCRNREVCYGAAYDETLDAVGRVTAALHGHGSCCKGDFSESFASRCIRSQQLIDTVNRRVSEITARIIQGGKNSFFAANCEDITALLADALDSGSEEYECDMETGERILEYLCSQALRVGGVVLYGKRCRHLVVKGVSLSDSLRAERIEEIRKRIGEIIGTEMTEPVFEVGKDGTVMLMHSCPTVKVSCAHGRLSLAEQESFGADTGEDTDADWEAREACGDTTEAFITDNSYFYSLISDGMGSGDEAAYTSGVCALFIEKMLSAGNRADITLRMLNNVIRSENLGCGSECSATVDLLELDLMSGVASFIKSGAAPTYIARQGTVYKVSARTMPVGIIKDADARITKFDTKKGDIIVMISDGCCHDSEDCSWLVEYLCDRMSRGREAVDPNMPLCERIKAEILAEAVKNAPEGEERDDISVSVVVVG